MMRGQILREQSLVPAGNRLRGLLGDERLTADEVETFSELRHDTDRDPPRFEP